MFEVFKSYRRWNLSGFSFVLYLLLLLLSPFFISFPNKELKALWKWEEIFFLLLQVFIYTATLIFRCTDKHAFHLIAVTVVSLYSFLSMHQGNDIFLEEKWKQSKGEQSNNTIPEQKKWLKCLSSSCKTWGR